MEVVLRSTGTVASANFLYLSGKGAQLFIRPRRRIELDVFH